MKKQIKKILLNIIIKIEKLDYGKDFLPYKEKNILTYNKLKRMVNNLK